MQGTRAAVVSCYRKAEDWAPRPIPGRPSAPDRADRGGVPRAVLIGPDDFARWLDDPEGLTWAMIGVEGFDALVRPRPTSTAFPRLFERGVRLFQPVYTASSVLGGSSVPGDDRGLTDLGRRSWSPADLARDGPGPARSSTWPTSTLRPRRRARLVRGRPSRRRRVLPVYSHGAPSHEGYDAPRALTIDNLAPAPGPRRGGRVQRRARRSSTSPDQVKAAIEAVAATPFRGRRASRGSRSGPTSSG